MQRGDLIEPVLIPRSTLRAPRKMLTHRRAEMHGRWRGDFTWLGSRLGLWFGSAATAAITKQGHGEILTAPQLNARFVLASLQRLLMPNESPDNRTHPCTVPTDSEPSR
jgi:hypothetical protein